MGVLAAEEVLHLQVAANRRELEEGLGEELAYYLLMEEVEGARCLE